MRGRIAAVAGAAVLLGSATPAFAASKGVEVLKTLPGTTQATAINFIDYRGSAGSNANSGKRSKGSTAGDVMFAVGRFGLKSYDITDPANPVMLDHLSSEELKLTGDTTGTFWQNEDMDVDRDRKLVFLARDPRAYGGTTSDPDDVAGVYIIDAANPADLRIRVFEQLPTGHTTTCVENCRYLWTGGPASNTAQIGDWPGGRPIFVTDITDPDNPHTFPQPVDTGRNDGQTAYAHDVQVDSAGIAWVSGRGGTRGYYTSGRHYDPVQGINREATPWDPVPYAGGAFEESAAPTKFMHNAFRPVGRTLGDGPQPGHRPPGDVLLATEEANGTPTCETVARLVIGSLEGSYDGESWRSTPEDPFRLKTLSTWSPTDQEGTDPNAAFCSAHYFDWNKRVLAYSWYDQGTRFVDVSDPRNPRQVAYHRPTGGVSWAPYYHAGHVYVADHGLGVQVLKLAGPGGGAKAASVRRKAVRAPRISKRHARKVARLMRGYRADPQLGWLCPIPKA